MPRPSIGSEPNARTFLSAFGRPVTLEDNKVITGIFKTRKLVDYDGQSRAVERTHYVLFVPEVLKETFAQEQFVVVDGKRYFAAAAVDVGDGWLESVLTFRSP